MTGAQISCGYVPLTDAAPLIIARELGFAAEEGVDLALVKYPSWSALRDMLGFGRIEAAHMLSPLPVAMSLGLGGLAARIDALMVLSVNGNVIGAAPRLVAAMQDVGWDGQFQTPAATARALRTSGGGPLRFGVPFPFSMHAELVRYWLGADPGPRDREIEITTVPPPLMAQALADGEVDAFCVGEPWGSLAVEQGHGRLILPGAAIWAMAPEKVLAVQHDWAETNPVATGALMRSVARAARWLDQQDNRLMAAEILSRSEYLGLPTPLLDRALSGHIQFAARAAEEEVPNFLRFFRNAASFPWRSQASWIGLQIARGWGIEPTRAVRVARRSFRSDLYRDHLADTGIDMPGASDKLEGSLSAPTAVASSRGGMILGPDGFFDGQIFDPAKF